MYAYLNVFLGNFIFCTKLQFCLANEIQIIKRFSMSIKFELFE